MRSPGAMRRSLEKKSLASARPHRQSRELLLLLRLGGVLLDVALILLRSRLCLARRDGLAAFIGTLLLIAHEVFPLKNLKNYFLRYCWNLCPFLAYTIAPLELFAPRKILVPINTNALATTRMVRADGCRCSLLPMVDITTV
jgi:hypothetical protein